MPRLVLEMTTCHMVHPEASKHKAHELSRTGTPPHAPTTPLSHHRTAPTTPDDRRRRMVIECWVSNKCERGPDLRSTSTSMSTLPLRTTAAEPPGQRAYAFVRERGDRRRQSAVCRSHRISTNTTGIGIVIQSLAT